MKSRRITALIVAFAMAISLITAANTIVTYADGDNWEFDLNIDEFDWTYSVSEIYGWGTKGLTVFGSETLGDTDLPFEVLINAKGIAFEVSAPPSGTSSLLTLSWIGDASLNSASVTGNTVIIRGFGSEEVCDPQTGTITLEFEKVWAKWLYDDFRSNKSFAGIGITYNSPDPSALNITRAYLYGDTPIEPPSTTAVTTTTEPATTTGGSPTAPTDTTTTTGTTTTEPTTTTSGSPESSSPTSEVTTTAETTTTTGVTTTPLQTTTTTPPTTTTEVTTTSATTTSAPVVTKPAESKSGYIDDKNNWEFDLKVDKFDWTYPVSDLFGWGTKGLTVHGSKTLGDTGLPFEVLIKAKGLVLELSDVPSGTASYMSLYWLGDASLNEADVSGNTFIIRGDGSEGVYDPQAKTITLDFEKVFNRYVHENFRKNKSFAGIGISYNPDIAALNITRVYLYGNTAPCKNCKELVCVCVNKGAIVDGENVTINDALEILKFLAGLPNAITSNGENSRQWQAATITGGDKPTIHDALEILKKLAKLPNKIDNP